MFDDLGADAERTFATGMAVLVLFFVVLFVLGYWVASVWGPMALAALFTGVFLLLCVSGFIAGVTCRDDRQGDDVNGYDSRRKTQT